MLANDPAGAAHTMRAMKNLDEVLARIGSEIDEMKRRIRSSSDRAGQGADKQASSENASQEKPLRENLRDTGDK